MTSTPKSLRLHIAIFGRTNVGKSSFLNLVTGQNVSIVSDQAGTTTDVVEKVMELLPIGPVVFLDTAGLDDTTSLGQKRIEKTEQVFDRADVVVLIHDGDKITEYENKIAENAAVKNLPIIRIANKADLPENANISDDFAIKCNATNSDSRDQILAQFKAELIKIVPDDFLTPPPLISDLIPKMGVVILVIPIDRGAPKGRIIQPQVAALREILDENCVAISVQETELKQTIELLKNPPDLVVCDSQVVDKVALDTPENVALTTFSILFARIKGDLATFAKGAEEIDQLKDGDKVLIAESCSHHATEDDIGRIKIPRWLSEYTGAKLEIDVRAGRDFPSNLSEYKLVVQCGGCMHNRREILSRIERAQAAGVPITNYGVCISKLHGVLPRAVRPFKIKN